jgi:hypothetical protein
MYNEGSRVLNNAYPYHISNVTAPKAFAALSRCLCNCSLTLISLQTGEEANQKVKLSIAQTE